MGAAALTFAPLRSALNARARGAGRRALLSGQLAARWVRERWGVGERKIVNVIRHKNLSPRVLRSYIRAAEAWRDPGSENSVYVERRRKTPEVAGPCLADMSSRRRGGAEGRPSAVVSDVDDVADMLDM